MITHLIAKAILMTLCISFFGGCYTQLNTVRTDEGSEYEDEAAYEDTLNYDEDGDAYESYTPNYQMMFGFYLPTYHRFSCWAPWYWDTYYYDPFYCPSYYPGYYGYWVPAYAYWPSPHYGYYKPHTGHYYKDGTRSHGATRAIGNTRGGVGIGSGRGGGNGPVTLGGRPGITRSPSQPTGSRKIQPARPTENRKPRIGHKPPGTVKPDRESVAPRSTPSGKGEGTGSDRGGKERVSQSPPRSSVPGSNSTGRSQSHGGNGGSRGGGSRGRTR